tara:strand:+ start:178401 stop:178628 length:228 start_codon:yes stop_codon:yes gene_type:complete
MIHALWWLRKTNGLLSRYSSLMITVWSPPSAEVQVAASALSECFSAFFLSGFVSLIAGLIIDGSAVRRFFFAGFS